MTADTFKVHNPTKQPQRLEFTHPTESHTIAPGASLELPIGRFRGVFHVLCRDLSCRALGWCTKAHAPDGAIQGGMAPALTYTPNAGDNSK